MNKYIKQLLKLAFFSIALVSPLHAADLEPLDVKDFSCGLVTAYDPTSIDNGCMQQGWNIDVWTGRIQKRRGSLLQNSTTLGSYAQPVRFLKEFPDQNGNKWLISVSSASLFKSNNSGAVNSVLTSSYGFTTSSEFQGINAFGKVRLVDGSTNSVVFDGNTVTVSTATPRGTVMAFMFERVFVANVSGANSTLFLSRFGDPEDWTDDGLADNDAFQLFIRQNDGYPIRAVVPYGNEALVFKDRSIDAVTMDNSGLVPIVTAISNTIGTSQPKSIQVRNNDVVFMGADGFYSVTGNSLSNISLGIKPTFDSILQKNSSARSLTLTTRTDFQTGVSTNISLTAVTNSIVLSTWSAVDTSSTDFLAGTLTNMNTWYAAGAIALSTSNTNITNNSFESGVTSWTFTGSAAVANNAAIAFDGSKYVDETSYDMDVNEVYFVAYDTASTLLLATTAQFLSNSWAEVSMDLGGLRGRNIRLALNILSTTIQTRVKSDTFLCSGSTVSVELQSFFSGGKYRFLADYFLNGASTITTGSFLSQTFDTAISSPSWLASSPTFTANGNTFLFEAQSATAASGPFDSLITWSTGTAPSSSTKRFIRYKITVTTAITSLSLPYVSDVTLAARSLSGSYLSAAQTIGSNINAWGAFASNNSSNGGNLTIAIYTDSNTAITLSNSSTWLSSQTITSGLVPTISTAPYLFFFTTMSITVSTQAPQVDDLVINWNEGAGNFPVASLFFEGDYLAAVSTKSTSANDTILVYDRNNHWSMYTGINCYSLSLYNQQAYCGDSITGNIYRIQVDNLYSDNGASIYSFWKSKEFDFGYPMTDKTMRKYFAIAKYNATSTLTFAYGVNRGLTTSSSLSLSSTSGFFRQVIAPSSLTYYRGITHSFSISNNVVNQYFDFLAIEMWPRLETPPGP